MLSIDKRILNILVIILLSFVTFAWTFWVLHHDFDLNVVLTVIVVRILASALIFKDYSLSWSKATQKTFILKSIVYLVAFLVYSVYFYGDVYLYILVSELFTYLFLINLMMYVYHQLMNRSKIAKTKDIVIYGAGKAGLKIEEELRGSEYRINYFVDDAKEFQGRSIDGIGIISKETLAKKIGENKMDLAIIAIPSAPPKRISEVYDAIRGHFHEIKILPPLENMLLDKPYTKQLKEIDVTDLLARQPKDLDKNVISEFLRDKTVLITGAGGSIGSEISRQCVIFGAKKLILLDHSEYNLYQIEQELNGKIELASVMQSVVNKEYLQETFNKHKPQIVIHAAAYKHVPLVEENTKEAILNNVIGTKNCIDVSIESGVEKFILISTDKAVRPTNVMGATKRVCELYAQNSNGNGTEIVGVRFGNVLGSSGSVIPKFRQQIEKGGPVTVTHPEITRYFMLIPEACELVLQAGAIGKGGEIFILDMGDPIKIVDLAKKMIELSGRDDIEIKFAGLRPGEKLYEELLIDDAEANTQYESIMIAPPTKYPIDKLNKDIDKLLDADDTIEAIRKIVPEFDHK